MGGWTEDDATALVGKTVKALTDLHAPVGTTRRITDVAFGDVSGWLCCVRWIDGSYSWIAADDDGTSVEIER